MREVLAVSRVYRSKVKAPPTYPRSCRPIAVRTKVADAVVIITSSAEARGSVRHTVPAEGRTTRRIDLSQRSDRRRPQGRRRPSRRRRGVRQISRSEALPNSVAQPPWRLRRKENRPVSELPKQKQELR